MAAGALLPLSAVRRVEMKRERLQVSKISGNSFLYTGRGKVLVSKFIIQTSVTDLLLDLMLHLGINKSSSL